MKLHAKVVTTTRQRLVTAWAFALMASVRFDVVMSKFVMSEDR
jgi:hypothetical protein